MRLRALGTQQGNFRQCPKQIRDGLHWHAPADHLGREGVSEYVRAGPRNDDLSSTQRPFGDLAYERPAELPIRRTRGYEDRIRRTGRRSRTQRGDQGGPNVGRQGQAPLPSPFAGHADRAVVPVNVLHCEGCDLACP